MSDIRFRRVVSMTSLLSIALAFLSGLVLYLAPQGRVAYWSDWRLWGLDKEAWTAVHINLTLLLVLASIVHLYFNWSALKAYLKNRRKRLILFTREFTLSLVLILAFTVGTLTGVPPFSSVLSLNDRIKERQSEVYGLPPYGHAELSPLAVFSKRTGLDPDRVLSLLEERGLQGLSPDRSLKEIAGANGISPQMLYEMVRTALPDPAPSAASSTPQAPMPGLGKMSLGDAARAYNFSTETALDRLAGKGITVTDRTTMKEAATALGITPADRLTLLR